MSVIDEVAAERVRQVFSEGYDPEHDDFHDEDELVSAAIAYAFSAFCSRGNAAGMWPWNLDEFKPRSPREDLIRAAALIIAEIERMDRAAS